MYNAHTMIEEIIYPLRINRYLLLKGFCSRRMADKLIERGEVNINGKAATLGQKVQEGDKVTVSKNMQHMPTNYSYYIYNKPRGIVSHNPQRGEQGVENVSGLGNKVSPVGRLDKASNGLMLLTDDGRIIDKILNPKFAHQREYEVTVDKKIKDRDLKRMAVGINIEGYMTKQAKTRRLGDKSFSITLIEGKKHQIRRMCAALGYQVKTLTRVRMMHLSINNLTEGKYRELTNDEKKELLDNASIQN